MDVVFIMKNFAAGFVRRAMKEWIKCPKRRKEIREFFLSNWGEMYCNAVGYQGKYILRLLEEGKIDLKALEKEIA